METTCIVANGEYQEINYMGTSNPIDYVQPESKERPAFSDVMNLQRIGGLLSKPFFQQFSEKHNLTLNEWRVVVVVHNQPGTAGHDVGRIAGIIPMNVSRAVATLKQAGRITSEPNPENRRQNLLYLTQAGEALFDEISPLAKEHAKKLFSVFSEEEREMLSEMLQRLYDQAERLLGD